MFFASDFECSAIVPRPSIVGIPKWQPKFLRSKNHFKGSNAIIFLEKKNARRCQVGIETAEGEGEEEGYGDEF